MNEAPSDSASSAAYTTVDAAPPASESAPPWPAAPRETPYPIAFTGTAGEYFRIWIANLALTVLTLGIYSAWAKVRKKRYFYAHTIVDGDSFDYRANPIAILKGRIIAVVLFAAYSFAGRLSPQAGLAALAVLLIAMPFLVTRSLAFNAYNSAYRNIRFHFHGRYGPLLGIVIGGGLLVVITVGLALPYVHARFVRFVVQNHAFGSTRVQMDKIAGAFYRAYAKAFGLVLVGVVLFLVVITAGRHGGMSITVALFGLLLLYATYLVVYAYVRAHTTNITFNAAWLGPVRFESRLRARDLMVLYFTNIVAILSTLGLATPWAVVRTFRYRASRTTLLAQGDLGQFTAAESAAVGATGQEVGEMFDFDFAL